MSTAPSSAGRRALITGGGAGIGAATARLLVGAAGAWRCSIGTARRPSAPRRRSAKAARAAIKATSPIPRRSRRVLDDMAAAWGGIDDLVNNAGIWDHAPLLDLTLARWQRVFDVNLLAPIEISNAAVRRMEPGSAIVNVSSVLGQVSAPTRGPYCVSKSALISLTKMQAIEWAERGIRVNAIAPGYITQRADPGARGHRQLRHVGHQPPHAHGPLRHRAGGGGGHRLPARRRTGELRHRPYAGSERRLDRLWLLSIRLLSPGSARAE